MSSTVVMSFRLINFIVIANQAFQIISKANYKSDDSCLSNPDAITPTSCHGGENSPGLS